MKKFTVRGLKITFHRKNREPSTTDENGRSLSSIEVAEPERPKTAVNGDIERQKVKESFLQTVKKRIAAKTQRKGRGRRGSISSSEDAFPQQTRPTSPTNNENSDFDYYNRPPRPKVYSSMRDRSRRSFGPLRAFNSEEALDKFEVHVEVHNEVGTGGGEGDDDNETKEVMTSSFGNRHGANQYNCNANDTYENVDGDDLVRSSRAQSQSAMNYAITSTHISHKETKVTDNSSTLSQSEKELVNHKGPAIPKRAPNPKLAKSIRSVSMHKTNQSFSDRGFDSCDADHFKDLPAPVYDLVNDQPHNSLTRELNKLSKRPWYWGPLTRNEAEEKLSNMPDGSFLVRDSSDDRYLLSLSFRSNGRTLHTRIEHSNGLFSFYPLSEPEGYHSIVDLIEHSMNDSRAGVFCYSRERLPGVRSYPVRLTSPVSRFTKVPSLQYLCRFVIRDFIRRDHIQKLPLPTRIKGYLEENHF
ncbi:suppressor of cytokine signaling 6-like [Ptychodera flava]|uniref:suppressor of cytokine signaling 6-like n=1 Tax=Ptychodera flava TaxID=63121 RepID=UPI00396A5B7B